MVVWLYTVNERYSVKGDTRSPESRTCGAPVPSLNRKTQADVARTRGNFVLQEDDVIGLLNSTDISELRPLADRILIQVYCWHQIRLITLSHCCFQFEAMSLNILCWSSAWPLSPAPPPSSASPLCALPQS